MSNLSTFQITCKGPDFIKDYEGVVRHCDARGIQLLTAHVETPAEALSV